MHIGLNFNRNLQEDKSEMNEGVLKEINKNTSSEFKASKKHKFGHGGKKSEGNVLCGEFACIISPEIQLKFQETFSW
jgi:hypothetical protein